MKEYLCVIAGAIGSFILALFGGWDTSLQTLIIFMIIDYITGVLVAGVFHNSPKTEGGGLETRAHFKGLCKKIVALTMVIVAYHLEMLSDINMIRNTVIIALVANETISILENAGLMGIPIPKVLKNALVVLQEQEGNDDENI